MHRYLNKDRLIGLSLFIAGLAAYTTTLAPTLLDGDAALFQYTPVVLGVTYPTGYPVYLFIAKIWLTLFPFGQIAWRMNLFSAVCAALALPVFYGVARHVLANRWAALSSALLFATIPTYWRWATEAKIYTLNILLFSIALWILTIDDLRLTIGLPGNKDAETQGDKVVLQKKTPPTAHRPASTKIQPMPAILTGGKQNKESPSRWHFKAILKGILHLVQNDKRQLFSNKTALPLFLGLFVMGLQLGVHSTTVLLLPGLMALLWLGYKHHFIQKSATGETTHLNYKQLGLACLVFGLPPATYLYIPLRGEWLVAQYGRQQAIAHGLIADFYHSGFAGWVRYFTAADFTGGVVTNWGQVPAQLYTVYLRALMHTDFGWFGLTWGLLGLLTFIGWPSLRRRWWPFLLLYALPIPFVLTYGQGEQNAFLLTSNLTFCLFAGGFIAWLLNLISTANQPAWLKHSLSVLLFSLTLILPWQRHQSNIEWLTHKWDTATYDYWAHVLSHPLAEEAGLMATWGDLTSMWYMQHIEDHRPDLVGLYPPSETLAADWLAQGHPLYIAGPVMNDWEVGLLERYHLIPWGRLVRLVPLTTSPHTLLPQLSQSPDITFADKLHLRGAEFASIVESGGTLTVYLTWQTLDALPAGTRYSLRLVQGDGIIAQKDDTLLSGWFPLDHLPADQPFVGAYPLVTPVGTLPGDYQLQVAIYERAGQEWPTPTGDLTLHLGDIHLKVAPATTPAGLVRFNGELTLDEVDFSVKRVGQGKGFQASLLWRALTPPQDNYTLQVALVDQTGHIWRTWQHPTETAAWSAGQQVRQHLDITIPAEAPPGPDSLSLNLSWQRPDGTHLPLNRWLFPLGQHLTLAAPEITLKPNRTFIPPQPQHPADINFADKAALIGFDAPRHYTRPAEGQPNLPLTLYWQGLGDIDQSYSVFVQLLDQNGHVAAQQDAVPGERNKQPTTSWAIGEYITDPVEIQLPPDFQPGTYTLITGLYLPPTGPRMMRLDQNGQPIADFVTLQDIEIE